MDIKITPRTQPLAPERIRIELAPRPTPAPASAPALSPLPHDEAATRKLTRAEILAEVRVAYAIIAESLARVGLDPAVCGIAVKMSTRFTSRMGDANTGSFSWAAPTGTIRLSASPLWRRATPAKRRNTVIHELAHILADCRLSHGAGRPRRAGHGDVWKAMMRELGEEPKRCHAVDRTGLRRKGSKAPRVVNADAVPTDFALGERVTFHARGRDVTGRIVQRNRKTVAVAADTGGKWTLHPALLKRIA